MARLVTSGFEGYVANVGGNAGFDGTNSGSTAVTRVTSGQRTGAACLRINTAVTPASASNTWFFTGALSRGYYARTYVKISALGGGSERILSVQSGNNEIGAMIDSSGRIFHSNATGTLSSAINDGAWHRIETYNFCSTTQASRAWELRVDGVTISSGTNQTDDSIGPTSMYVGWSLSQSADIFFDDVALNDSTGSANNSWCGAGAVLLLVPTADNAVGTNWTRGNGTVISGGNGFQSVDNVPPAGIADLGGAGADTGQLRNAGSNANSNYDATMQTYTAAGVPSGATINAVIPLVFTGAPVVTSAKAGTVGVVSNPAITNVALGPGGTGGAFWSGTAAGTWPTGWKGSQGTAADNPSITLGTAPVMRITQVTASTRIAIVCFMGIYVDFTAVSGTTYTKAGYAKEGA